MKSFGFTHRVAEIIAIVALFSLGSVYEGKADESSLVGDYPVTVDCAKPLTEMFNADLYGYIAPNILLGIPPIECSGVVNITITILSLDEIFNSPMEVSILLGRKGCRSATLAELIALDNTHYKTLVLHKGGPVILAYGTVWSYVPPSNIFGYPGIFSGIQMISVLRFDDSGRNLGGALAYPDPPWKISKAHLAAVCASA